MRKVKITPYRNGPYVIRGDFEIIGQDGGIVDPRRKTIALCRCGASRTKPFCDGTHKRIGFNAPSVAVLRSPGARASSSAGSTKLD